MSSPPSDPYADLQVSKDASAQEIKTAYRKLVLKCHPDKVQDPALKEEMQNKFHKVQQAYDILGDEKERRKHDELAENLAKLNNLRQKAATAAKANTSSPRPAKSSSSEYYPETRSSNYRAAPEPRPSYSYTTRYYTRSSDNEPDIIDAEPPPSSRRREGSSYVDRERDSRSSKRESERAYQKEKDRERERESEKERKRREKQEKIDKEERKRDRARRQEQEDKERRREEKRQRERQESKARKSETREKAAREAYPTPPPMVDDYVPMPKEKKSSSRKHRADRDVPVPDYLEGKMSHALHYQTMAQGVQNVQSRSSAPPLAPTPPPTVSPYASPEEDAPRRRSSTRRGSSDAQRVREKRSYNSKSSREHLDNLDEEPMPSRLSRTHTMPMESTHTASRPPPVPIPGNLNRAHTDMSMNRGRGRSRMESQVDMSEEEEEPRRGRDRDDRERKSSRQPKKSSSYREERYQEIPAYRHVYSIDKGQDGVSRTKPLQRSSTGYSTRGGYDESSYPAAYYAEEPAHRYVRPQMETRTSSYQSSKYSNYPSPTEYSSNYGTPRYGKSYNAADVEFSKPVRV